MKLHEAIVQYGLVGLLTMVQSSYLSMGLSDDDLRAINLIKTDYIVRERRKVRSILSWRDAIDAANIPADNREHIMLICTDHNDVIVGGVHNVAIGSRDAIAVCKQQIYSRTANISAVKAYLVHNHPRGGRLSGFDVKFTFEVRNLLASMNCNLEAHYVIDSTGVQDVVSGQTYYLVPCNTYTPQPSGACGICGHSKEEHDDWIQQAESELNDY